jgi:hypothetical protein
VRSGSSLPATDGDASSLEQLEADFELLVARGNLIKPRCCRVALELRDRYIRDLAAMLAATVALALAMEEDAVGHVGPHGIQPLGDQSVDLGESWTQPPQEQKDINDMYAMFGHAPPKPIKIKKAPLTHKKAVHAFEQLLGEEDKMEKGDPLEKLVDQRAQDEDVRKDASMNHFHDIKNDRGNWELGVVSGQNSQVHFRESIADPME